MQLSPDSRGKKLNSGGRKHKCFIPAQLKKKHSKNSVSFSAYVRWLEAGTESVNWLNPLRHQFSFWAPTTIDVHG